MSNLGQVEVVVTVGVFVLAGYIALRFLVALRNGMRQESRPEFQPLKDKTEKPKRD